MGLLKEMFEIISVRVIRHFLGRNAGNLMKSGLIALAWINLGVIA